MPPLHPDVVHFSIALVFFAFAADVVGFGRRSAPALTIGWWSLVWGFVATLVTAAAGYIDMERAHLAPGTHDLVDLHFRAGLVIVVLLIGVVTWRAVIRRREATARPVGYLLCFAALCLLIAFQGWYGGELAYAHGAGVAATGQGMAPPERAAARIKPAAELLGKLPAFGHDDRDEDEHEKQPWPAKPPQ